MHRRLLLQTSALAATGALVGCKKEVECPPPRITAEEQAQRTALKYVDHTSDENKECGKCQQFIPDPDDGCGSCKLLKGPIHPAGTCIAFAAKG